jgi:phage terminase large subunit
MLKISRADVTGEEITQYSVEERFIKYNIEKYFRGSSLEMYRPQIAIVNALNNPAYKFVVAAVSRRLGKTFIANVIAHLVSLVPGMSILIISPNYSLSEVSFELQESLLAKFNLEVERSNLKDRIITLKNGSSIRLGSVNQVDSRVGRSYHFIIFDEAGLTDDGKDAFETQLLPTLDQLGSKALFISTPRGSKNWFAEYYYRGFSVDHPTWVSIQADYTENPRLSPETITAARASMSADKFSQEFEACFTVFEGQIYKFDESKCSVEIDFNTDTLEIFMGIDIGFKDPTAILVIGYAREENLYYILDEYQERYETTSKHAVAVRDLISKYGSDMIFIDSAAAQTRHDWAVEHDIPTIPAKKSILDGIAFIQSIVEQNRLLVNNKCVKAISMLNQLRWDAKANLLAEKPVRDDHIHLADALRYALYSYNTTSGVY